MSRSRSVVFAAVAISLVSIIPGALHAQFPAEIRPGARGTVEEVTPDMLRLSIPGTAGPLSIPRSSVRRMQLSRGAPSRPASAIERAIGGALGGAVTWAAMNDPRRRGGPHYATDWRAAGVGASWGAGFGALVGLIFPHEQWQRVRLHR